MMRRTDEGTAKRANPLMEGFRGILTPVMMSLFILHCTRVCSCSRQDCRDPGVLVRVVLNRLRRCQLPPMPPGAPHAGNTSVARLARLAMRGAPP